jgi:hypothetical protein
MSDSNFISIITYESFRALFEFRIICSLEWKQMGWCVHVLFSCGRIAFRDPFLSSYGVSKIKNQVVCSLPGHI